MNHYHNWIWNRFAKLGVFPNELDPERFVVYSPSRKRGLLKQIVDKSQSRLWALLQNLAEYSQMCSEDKSMLVELGLVLPEEDVPRFRPAFRCWLDEVKDVQDSPPSKDLILNPDRLIELEPSMEPPIALLETTFEWGTSKDWFLPCPRIWIQDSHSGARFAYGLRGDYINCICDLQDRSQIASLTDRERAQLYAIGALICVSKIGELTHKVHDARMHMHQHQFASMADLLPLAQLRAFTAYAYALQQEGFVKFGDSQVARRFAAHDEGVSRYLHHEFTPLVSQIFGLELVPSYCYLASYLPGAVLHRHVDREQSAFSLNILLDAFPLNDGCSTWPLSIENRLEQQVSLFQSPGEGIFYEGAKLPHWRPALPPNSRSLSIFLQYVPITFEGSLL